MQLGKVEKFITELLITKLPDYLFYHCYDHTFDVLNASALLANEENISREEDIILLKTAALFHDSGFVNVYKNHEEAGCLLAQEFLPRFDYNETSIKVICSMIMKTKYGALPETILQKILCDADLDYLGRDDYEVIAAKLYHELTELKKIKGDKEWNRLQVQFLQSHKYWTNAAQLKRNAKKLMQLNRLRLKTLDYD